MFYGSVYIIHIVINYVNYCIKINLPKFFRVYCMHCSANIRVVTIFKTLNIDWNVSYSEWSKIFKKLIRYLTTHIYLKLCVYIDI